MLSIKWIAFLFAIIVHSTAAFFNNDLQLEKQFPYLVRIELSNGDKRTGSIINKSHVLTVSIDHYGHKSKDLNIIYRSKYLYRIVAIVANSFTINYQIVNANLMVLDAEAPFEIDENSTVVIPKSHEQIPIGLQGKLIIWNQVSEVLDKVIAFNLTVSSDEVCKQHLNKHVVFDEKYFFCAGSNISKTGLDVWDIGAPFMHGHKQLGILYNVIEPGSYLLFRTSAIYHQLHHHHIQLNQMHGNHTSNVPKNTSYGNSQCKLRLMILMSAISILISSRSFT